MKVDARLTTTSPVMSPIRATTSNLWLKSIEFKQSQNEEQSCNDILKDKYTLLAPSNSQYPTIKPIITTSLKSSSKPLENLLVCSRNSFNATFPELIDPNGMLPNIQAGPVSEDSPKPINETAALPPSKSDAPKPKFMINKPSEVVLEWGAKIVNKAIGPGLTNLGNTCFMNSVIQCLTYCPPFFNLVAGSDHVSKCHFKQSCMACTFKGHFEAVCKYGLTSISPRNFAVKLKVVSKGFHWGNQEDAHEYLRHVIDNMCRKAVLSAELDLNKMMGAGPTLKLDPRSKETTIFNHIFGGYLRSQIQCLSCKFTSSTYDHFMDLMLEIRGADTLEKALKKFTALEVLDDENSYKCTGCKTKSKATKKFTIHTPPNVLTVQLKRFGNDSRFLNKVTKHVSYPEELNLQPYISNPSIPLEDVTYKLFGVLVHDGGSCKSGHYYCYVKNYCGSWYLMNDSHVERTNIRKVLSKNAYILFYVRKAKSKNNGLTKPLTPNGFADKLKTVTNGSPVSAYGSSVTTLGKFTGCNIPMRKPQLSDPSASPIKGFFKNSTSSVMVKSVGNRPAIISDRPKNKKASDTDLDSGSTKVCGSKRLVEYSDESDLDEPMHKKSRQSGSKISSGIKIFSNSSSSNSLSSLSDHSSCGSSPHSNGAVSELTTSNIPVMNGSNTVITKEIIHKESSFDCSENGSILNIYGTQVKSWCGNTNSIDQNIEKERREDEIVSREEDEYNNDFDTGKVKKIKTKNSVETVLSSKSPTKNPFDSHLKGGKVNNFLHSKNHGPFSTHWNRLDSGARPQHYRRYATKHHVKYPNNSHKNNHHRR